MTAYLVSVHLLIEANNSPHAEVADALRGILTGDMRKYAGVHSALIDWAVAGDDIAGSIIPVAIAGDYEPDETAFPLWPRGPRR
jgi:hypothetical protein